MWANILLIMKDVSTPQRFWVLLPCHEKTFTKVEGKCITRVWKTTAWMWGLVVQRLFVRILTVFGSVRYNEAGRMHIGWVCWCSQITYCWDVGNVGAIPVCTAVLGGRVLWHDILRRDLRGRLTEGSAVVGTILLTTVARICLIKMEVVSVKFMKAGAPGSESDTWGGSKLLEMCQ